MNTKDCPRGPLEPLVGRLRDAASDGNPYCLLLLEAAVELERQAREAVRKWIPTSEQLPDDGASVAFVVKATNMLDYLDGRVLGGTYHANPITGGFGVPGLQVAASFWQPLPQPPNAGLSCRPPKEQR